MGERFRTTIVRANGLLNHPALRKGLQVVRWPLYAVALVLLLRYGQREWFWPGLIVSATGEVLQLWCFACIDTRRRLATKGPYALVRNPMYLARYLLLLGMVLWSGRWWVGVLFTLLYTLYMVNRVRREEILLRVTFGDAYEQYCAEVRRFLPRFRRGVFSTLTQGISAANFRRQHGSRNAFAVVMVYVLGYWFLSRRP